MTLLISLKAVGASVRIFQLLDRVSEVPNGSDVADPFKGGKIPYRRWNVT